MEFEKVISIRFLRPNLTNRATLEVEKIRTDVSKKHAILHAFIIVPYKKETLCKNFTNYDGLNFYFTIQILAWKSLLYNLHEIFENLIIHTTNLFKKVTGVCQFDHKTFLGL